MSTVSSPTIIMLAAIVNVIEKHKSIVESLHAKEAEQEEAMDAMDAARERAEAFGCVGKAPPEAKALLVVAEQLYADKATEKMQLLFKLMDGDDELSVACAAAGMRESEAFAHYFGSVVESTPETRAMVAWTAKAEDEAAAAAAAGEDTKKEASSDAESASEDAESASEDADEDTKKEEEPRAKRPRWYYGSD